MKRFFSLFAIFILGLTMVIGLTACPATEDVSSDYSKTCNVCHRTFTDTGSNSNCRSITRTGMCKNCYNNYKFATGGKVINLQNFNAKHDFVVWNTFNKKD